MHQKATKYTSSGNNVLLKHVVQTFFPGKSLYVSFQLSIFVPNFQSYMYASTSTIVEIWDGGAMRRIQHIYPDTHEV